METTTININVPEDVARAYEHASAPDRRRAERALAFALRSRAQAAAELEQLLERMSKTAAARGLTEEKLQKLLKDD